MAAACERRAFDHHAHAFIAAHRINGDTRQAHAQYSGFSSRLKADRDNLATVVVAAMRAQIVRPLELTTVRTLVMSFDLQRIVCAAITTAVGRYFSLGDSHGGTCSSNKSVNLWAALGQGHNAHKSACAILALPSREAAPYK